MNTDKENTVRGLQGRPLLAHTLCKFGWHKWGKWQVTKTMAIKGSGVNIIQMHKDCDGCGFKQFKIVAPKEIENQVKYLIT